MIKKDEFSKASEMNALSLFILTNNKRGLSIVNKKKIAKSNVKARCRTKGCNGQGNSRTGGETHRTIASCPNRETLQLKTKMKYHLRSSKYIKKKNILKMLKIY